MSTISQRPDHTPFSKQLNAEMVRENITFLYEAEGTTVATGANGFYRPSYLDRMINSVLVFLGFRDSTNEALVTYDALRMVYNGVTSSAIKCGRGHRAYYGETIAPQDLKPLRDKINPQRDHYMVRISSASIEETLNTLAGAEEGESVEIGEDGLFIQSFLDQIIQALLSFVRKKDTAGVNEVTYQVMRELYSGYQEGLFTENYQAGKVLHADVNRLFGFIDKNTTLNLNRALVGQMIQIIQDGAQTDEQKVQAMQQILARQERFVARPLIEHPKNLDCEALVEMIDILDTDEEEGVILANMQNYLMGYIDNHPETFDRNGAGIEYRDRDDFGCSPLELIEPGQTRHHRAGLIEQALFGNLAYYQAHPQLVQHILIENIECISAFKRDGVKGVAVQLLLDAEQAMERTDLDQREVYLKALIQINDQGVFLNGTEKSTLMLELVNVLSAQGKYDQILRFIEKYQGIRAFSTPTYAEMILRNLVRDQQTPLTPIFENDAFKAALAQMQKDQKARCQGHIRDLLLSRLNALSPLSKREQATFLDEVFQIESNLFALQMVSDECDQKIRMCRQVREQAARGDEQAKMEFTILLQERGLNRLLAYRELIAHIDGLYPLAIADNPAYNPRSNEEAIRLARHLKLNIFNDYVAHACKKNIPQILDLDQAGEEFNRHTHFIHAFMHQAHIVEIQTHNNTGVK
ncbi:MAG: hypothetical protein S4CHLAM102_03510 [Chlamydiia bacterium]|nr:hypothetical protein [Chlamydiia bacterium]